MDSEATHFIQRAIRETQFSSETEVTDTRVLGPQHLRVDLSDNTVILISLTRFSKEMESDHLPEQWLS